MDDLAVSSENSSRMSEVWAFDRRDSLHIKITISDSLGSGSSLLVKLLSFIDGGLMGSVGSCCVLLGFLMFLGGFCTGCIIDIFPVVVPLHLPERTVCFVAFAGLFSLV